MKPGTRSYTPGSLPDSLPVRVRFWQYPKIRFLVDDGQCIDETLLNNGSRIDYETVHHPYSCKEQRKGRHALRGEIDETCRLELPPGELNRNWTVQVSFVVHLRVTQRVYRLRRSPIWARTLAITLKMKIATKTIYERRNEVNIAKTYFVVYIRVQIAR
jgi:hypothetical protein